MSKKSIKGISKSELEASEKRAARLKEVNEELKNSKDTEMARMLEEIALKNNKSFDK